MQIEHYYLSLEEIQRKVLNDIHDYIQTQEISSAELAIVQIVSMKDDRMELKIGPYNFLIELTARLSTKLITIQTYEVVPNLDSYPDNKLTLIDEMKAVCHLAGFFKIVGTDVPKSVNISQDRLQAGSLYFNCLLAFLAQRERAEFEKLDADTKKLFE